MNKTMIAGGVLATMIAATGLAGVVMAQQPGTPPALTEAQAIEIALARVPGEIQETELEREDGKQVYEIEILTADGQEFEVEIDASDGTVLEVEREDEDRDDRKSPT